MFWYEYKCYVKKKNVFVKRKHLGKSHSLHLLDQGGPTYVLGSTCHIGEVFLCPAKIQTCPAKYWSLVTELLKWVYVLRYISSLSFQMQVNQFHCICILSFNQKCVMIFWLAILGTMVSIDFNLLSRVYSPWKLANGQALFKFIICWMDTYKPMLIMIHH